ncbi:MAG: ATP-dependent DNA helicase, partial [Bdellovibrionales bacterium]
SQSSFSQGQSFSSAKAKYRDDFDQSFPDYDSVDQSSGAADYIKGQKVKHPTFGAGTIFSVEGTGEQTKVSVLFADQTIKKFVVKYARLERV